MILRCDASGCVLSHWTSLYRIYRLVGMIGQDPQELGWVWTNLSISALYRYFCSFLQCWGQFCSAEGTFWSTEAMPWVLRQWPSAEAIGKAWTALRARIGELQICWYDFGSLYLLIYNEFGGDPKTKVVALWVKFSENQVICHLDILYKMLLPSYWRLVVKSLQVCWIVDRTARIAVARLECGWEWSPH